MTRPQTVVKEQYDEENVIFSNDLFERHTCFTIHGQTVERSYEDREVYLYISQKDFKKNSEYSRGITEWLRAEDAITLGTKLIEHGRRAMLANMYNHQLIHQMSQVEKHLMKGDIKEFKVICLNREVPNYGNGHYLFRVVAIFHKGRIPKYSGGLSYEMVEYFSPFKEEFDKRVKQLFGDLPVTFIGYNREEEVERFRLWCDEINSESAKTKPTESLDPKKCTYVAGYDPASPDGDCAILTEGMRDKDGNVHIISCRELTPEEQAQIPSYSLSGEVSFTPACNIQKIFGEGDKSDESK